MRYVSMYGRTMAQSSLSILPDLLQQVPLDPTERGGTVPGKGLVFGRARGAPCPHTSTLPPPGLTTDCLQNAREGDPNAVLRVAKMYLYGAGCDPNVNITMEWLRKAR
jgi:TPR repeat protein